MNGIALGINKIQNAIKEIEKLDKYKDKVRNFVERYDTDNIIFNFNGSVLVECVKGFFEVYFETDNLDEALNNLHINSGIQILGREDEHRSYRLGKIVSELNECMDDSKVVNIKSLEDLF